MSLLQLAAAAMGAAAAGVAQPPPFNLSATITSHMVLQRKPAKVVLWGWGNPGVSLHLRGCGTAAIIGAATVGTDGQWRMALPPQPAGAAFGCGNLSLTDEARAGQIELTGELLLSAPLRCCLRCVRCVRSCVCPGSCVRPLRSSTYLLLSRYELMRV